MYLVIKHTCKKLKKTLTLLIILCCVLQVLIILCCVLQVLIILCCVLQVLNNDKEDNNTIPVGTQTHKKWGWVQVQESKHLLSHSLSFRALIIIMYKCSWTSLARIRMARTPWIAWTVFFSPVNFTVNSLSNKPKFLEH